MKGSRYGLALEGWPIVLVLAAVAAWLLGSSWSGAAVLPGLLLLLAVLKFRDPPRTVPADPLGVLSPVDGVVTHIVQSAEGAHLLLRIAPLGAYFLRSPTEGKVLESGRERGGHGLRIRTDEGEEVRVRLLGPDWLPAAAAVGYGQRVGQGQRCGLLRFARAAEIWLPAGATVLVDRGARVCAGVTVLGHFPPETNNRAAA